MTDQGYEIIQLPTYTNEPENERENISRNINFKGEFARLAISEMNYLAYVDFQVGKGIRANHYHEKKDEYLYICKGKVKGYFKMRSQEDHEIKEVIIEEGSLIHMLPGCIHAFEAIEEGHGIEFSPTKYEFIERDLIPYKLVHNEMNTPYKPVGVIKNS